MMRLPTALALAVTALVSYTQEWKEIARINSSIDAFTTDELGNIYVLNGDVLELYDANGLLLMRNSAKTFGRIDVIDAFYSLKPMVFSGDQKQIAVLDNTLAVQGSVIDLSRNDSPWVTHVCAGVQNSFWFFDERELSLTRVDAQLRSLASTGRLDQLLGFTPHPTMMQEANSRLFVNDPEQGVMVFDLFGAYLKTLPITGAQRIEARGGSVFFFREGRLWSYDQLSFATQAVPWPEGLVATDARLERDRLFARTADGITIFSAARK